MIACCQCSYITDCKFINLSSFGRCSGVLDSGKPCAKAIAERKYKLMIWTNSIWFPWYNPRVDIITKWNTGKREGISKEEFEKAAFEFKNGIGLMQFDEWNKMYSQNGVLRK